MAKQVSKKAKENSKKKIFEEKLEKFKSRRYKGVKLHKSFKRSYREDYIRELQVPGIMAHLAKTFSVIFKNKKIFGLLLVFVVIANIILVGLMNETMYKQFQDVLDETSESVLDGKLGAVPKAGLLLVSTITTGGLSTTMSESQTMFLIIILLIVWLVTIYVLRHRFAGHVIKLRDALYNACAPIISTFIVLAIIFFECIPIFIFIVAYSTAVQTNFLATPFYALLFFLFSVLMFAISGYLLSSSVVAMVAVSAPGLYPMKAIHTAHDLMMGRRIKFIIRLLGLFIALAIMWTVIMVPFILLDLWIKTYEWAAGIPFIPLILSIMTILTVIYVTTYLYIYYRWMLDYEEK